VPNEVPEVAFRVQRHEGKILRNVLAAKKYITAGDIIQVVGSQRFSAPVKASPMDIYRAVRSINPSPYMFLLELDGFSLVGASPEVHVRCEEGKVEIRPIAGTRRRGKKFRGRQALEKELLADPKERAEHVMLVDLARNDIGRVCDFGSVQVKDLMIIERYSHVMHIVSQVEGKLAPPARRLRPHARDVPGRHGQRRAENPRHADHLRTRTDHARPYAGCVGYFSFNGNLDTCITIRTALLKDGKAYVQAGGGWVNDSTPEGRISGNREQIQSHAQSRGDGGLLLLFFGSGCAALVYEIVWLQMLQLFIGSSAVSLGVLVGTYMGGMCLGSVVLPRMISATRHPLWVYALLEFGIGVLGILILFGMPTAAQIYSAHTSSGLAGIFCSAVCLRQFVFCRRPF
jgi:hypothetical protein